LSQYAIHSSVNRSSQYFSDWKQQRCGPTKCPPFSVCGLTEWNSIPYRPLGPSRHSVRPHCSVPPCSAPQLRMRNYAEDVMWRLRKHPSVEGARGMRAR